MPRVAARALTIARHLFPTVRLLHTADWHLGARLVERDRLDEHAAFLTWLLEVIRAEKVDALLVSGDVFDAANPPQEAVALYFDFIRRLAELPGVSAVITGGNHDSPAHLNAPRELLRHFRVHVFGHAPERHDDCLVGFDDAVVAAVPFLRERDLRRAAAGETSAQAQKQLVEAIRTHYAAVAQAGRAMAGNRPLLAMGHLTALGATTSDSEREIHIGNLGRVTGDVFAGFDHTALGHLHRPQCVGGNDCVRYSGSPLALSFSEAGDAKSVCLMDVAPGRQPVHTVLAVPQTRRLVRVACELSTLELALAPVPAGVWAEIAVSLAVPDASLDRRVHEAAGGRFDVLKVLAELPPAPDSVWEPSAQALDELAPAEVFRARLAAAGLPPDAEPLTATFHELMALHAGS